MCTHSTQLTYHDCIWHSAREREGEGEGEGEGGMMHVSTLTAMPPTMWLQPPFFSIDAWHSGH